MESQARSRLAECSFEFLGTVTAEQVKSLQDQSRLQCVPSIWPDNSPLVIYESLSRGLPLVASRTGGIPDLIRSEQEGLLVPPGDVQALSDKICQLLGDDVLCARLSQAALTRAKEFSMDTHIEKLGTIYAEVVGVGRA